MKKFDAIIIGAGPAGLMCAYSLVLNKPDARILIVEEGSPVETRVCPVDTIGKCVHCPVCAITHGAGGGGGFSDGKFSKSNPGDEHLVGGELEKFRPQEEIEKAIEEVLSIYIKFGAPSEVVGGNSHPAKKKYSKLAEKAGLELVTVPFIHTGTTKARAMFYNIEQELVNKGVNIEFYAKATDILHQGGKAIGVEYLKHGRTYKVFSPQIILNTGRSGASSWNRKICQKLGVKSHIGRKIKVGVRYELPDEVMADSNLLYEPKFKARATKETDAALTFCHNPSGSVVCESYDGEITVANGHADAGISPTGLTNMALLFKMDLGENSIEVAKSMARTINLAANGQVMVQRCGDFVKNLRTEPEHLARNSVQPTLKAAYPSNLQWGMTPRLVNNIITFVNQIDKVLPGFAGPDNLLYGLEMKFSNFIIELDQDLMTSLPGLYAIGDGAGLTNGLIQASASGWLLGEILAK